MKDDRGGLGLGLGLDFRDNVGCDRTISGLSYEQTNTEHSSHNIELWSSTDKPNTYILVVSLPVFRSWFNFSALRIMKELARRWVSMPARI